MSGRRALCVVLAVSVIASVVIIVVTAALDPAGRGREEGPPEQEPVPPT